MAKQKFYVVWNGAEDGVYTSWEACKEAVEGFSGAKYQAFKTEAEAEEAFEMGYEKWKEQEKEQGARCKEQEKEQGAGGKEQENTQHSSCPSPLAPCPAINEAIAVDAACSGNPGKMEYRGVYLRTGKEIFHYGPQRECPTVGEAEEVQDHFGTEREERSIVPTHRTGGELVEEQHLSKPHRQVAYRRMG